MKSVPVTPVLRVCSSLIFAALFCGSPKAFAAEPQAPPYQPVVVPAANEMASLSPEMRGDLLMFHQQYLAAIDAYRQGPKDSAIIWNKIGIAYHHMFALKEAKLDYERAISLNHNYPEALNNLGAIYYAEKDYHKAERYYRRAIHLSPRAAAMYSNLGTAYFADGKFRKGSEEYRKAFLLDPHVFEGTSVQMVSESSPLHERARQDYCLAKLFAQAGMQQQALKYLRKAIDEGFDDRRKIFGDEELATLRTTAEFAHLMAEQRIQQ
ncbi:tetratricopeptide repeat protein [Paracidobacterium acidisoli]|uniref:Tetratricopeptide repeat protein n=1 Tax=Paracidobacterium acidisoli TaxID=2303751 RepID=A0A372IPE5_9BACT|nr:tetratricopeptide repeat protein [Paracidobacterium acidisoli]MBT9331052.1 tetratricopeptide repeat protein [Paracidobacterium acidisoli]